MDCLLDLTEVGTKRVFIVGGLHGNHDALMRHLYHQKFGWKDTLVLAGGIFDETQTKSLDLTVFLRNSMNCYAVKGAEEQRLLSTVQDPAKLEIIEQRFGVKLNELVISYIQDLPLVIKVRDYYIMTAGIDPNLPIEDQDPEVFYTIGKYDKDSRFYQDAEEGVSWYDAPYLVDGKHVKICFSLDSLEDIEVPAGYNLGRDPEKASAFRCLILDRTVGTPVLTTFF